jgi:TetR/AcrR family transcriptional regulator, transcriptional repressor for nem operon
MVITIVILEAWVYRCRVASRAESEMGVSKEKVKENRVAIVAASEKLFRAYGIDGVGLSSIMKTAGFTQGGFYNHFSSKEELAVEVVASAMAKGSAHLKAAAVAPERNGQTRMARQLRSYLSKAHRDDIEQGCPVAGLASDVGRLSPDAQSHFAKGLNELVGTLSKMIADESIDLGDAATRTTAISVYCQMVGALVLSRAVVEGDPVLAQEILSAGRKSILDGKALMKGPTAA